MIRHNILHTIALPLMLAACMSGCSSELAVKKANLGSDISPDGTISQAGLIYTFKKPAEFKTCRDLFNYIYFEGDTVCFSFTLTREVEAGRVQAHFLNPLTGESFRAERVDIIGKNIAGFSLLGSVMESFYAGSLARPLPTQAFCCESIPFVVRLVITDEKEPLTRDLSGSLEIRYRD